MNSADSVEPSATIQMHARCTRLGSRFQPNSHSPRNVDSKKNAARLSIANGPPNTSPTYFEYVDQFIPNSNSCTRPVTTPTATLIVNSTPKNRVSRRYSGCWLRYHAVCSSATRNASPIVTGTNRKW